MRQPPVHRDVERRAPAVEVLVELASHGVELLGVLDHPRRDVVGQVLEEDVLFGAGQRHPDEPLVGGGQEHRSDRRVELGPRDFDEPFAVSAATEAGKRGIQ